MRTLLVLLLSAQAAIAGFGKYSDLVVADAVGEREPGGVRITYLGTNGYRLEAAGRTLLIDPYFSRVSLARVALGWPLGSDRRLIDKNTTNGAVDAILVTHGHFDHLLDAPVLMKKTGARLIASATAVELARRAGAPPNNCDAVVPGANRSIGPWRIAVLPAAHDRLAFIGVPYNGPPKDGRPPLRARDWVCGEPLSYLVTVGGMKIFIDSGGTPSLLPPGRIGPVDLAILGMALPDSRARFAAAVQRLQPRYVLASHQDNFFLPLRRGFQFGPLTDFGFVRRIHRTRNLAGKLILLDYFRPWTLPAKS